MAKKLRPVICPYCDKPAELVGGSVVYPSRPDLKSKRFYLCRKCSAWVGCHAGTNRPLGRLADKALRRVRQQAHAAFDPIWKCGKTSRTQAYRWLADKMGLPLDDTHIAKFTVEQCKQVVAICNEERLGNAEKS